MIEYIKSNDLVLAIVMRNKPFEHGATFISKNNDPLQVGLICYDEGHIIKAHRHLEVELSYKGIKPEYIHLDNGEIKVNFFDLNNKFCSSKRLFTGDSLIQFAGGHEFIFILTSKIIEVKLGPYDSVQNDKEYI